MAKQSIVQVSRLKEGLRLSKDVLTKAGNTLLEKNQVISQREIDILQAFLIQTVTVEITEPADNELLQGLNEQTEDPHKGSKANSKANHPDHRETAGVKAGPSSFFRHYMALFKVLHKEFNEASIVNNFQLLEIRNAVSEAISHIQDFNPLTFFLKQENMEDQLIHHSIKVALSAYLLATWLELPKKDRVPVALAGIFHDIGMLKVDPAILRKRQKLTNEEQAELQKHTILGYNLLKNIAGMNEGIKLTALQHHEKQDGTGYPFGVKNEKIHLYAKIVTIADIYHAMSTKRYYRPAFSPYQSLEQLWVESFGKLEHQYVRTFIYHLTKFNNGTIVRLNDDTIGEIVFCDQAYPTRPWVKVKDHIINLTTNRHLFIQEVLESKSNYQ